MGPVVIRILLNPHFAGRLDDAYEKRVAPIRICYPQGTVTAAEFIVAATFVGFHFFEMR